MNKITLPPLPEPLCNLPTYCQDAIRQYTRTVVDDYLNEQDTAIEADRKRRGEVVVSKTPEGEIIAVTRQDDEGRILSVIAEADSKRSGEPVACFKCGHAKHGGECVNVAPQPAEPEKVPSETKEALWKAYESLRELEKRIVLDVNQISGAAAASFAANRVRALLARYGNQTQEQP